jgi:hypothetical protein
MDKTKKMLQGIQATLEKAGLDVLHVPMQGDSLVEKLVVFGGKDRDDRAHLIEIGISGSAAAEKKVGKEEIDLDPALRVQIDSAFTFSIADIAYADLAQFLHFINLQIELPGFYLDHLNEKVIYRYVLLFEGETIPKKTLLSLIGVVLFLQDVFGQTLERLASGQVTFLGLMEELEKSLYLNKVEI